MILIGLPRKESIRYLVKPTHPITYISQDWTSRILQWLGDILKAQNYTFIFQAINQSCYWLRLQNYPNPFLRYPRLYERAVNVIVGNSSRIMGEIQLETCWGGTSIIPWIMTFVHQVVKFDFNFHCSALIICSLFSSTNTDIGYSTMRECWVEGIWEEEAVQYEFLQMGTVENWNCVVSQHICWATSDFPLSASIS